MCQANCLRQSARRNLKDYVREERVCRAIVGSCGDSREMLAIIARRDLWRGMLVVQLQESVQKRHDSTIGALSGSLLSYA